MGEHADDDDPALALTRRGTRFAESATEQAFRFWRHEDERGRGWIGTVASALLFVACHVVVVVRAASGTKVLWSAAFAWCYVTFGLLAWAAARRRVRELDYLLPLNQISSGALILALAQRFGWHDGDALVPMAAIESCLIMLMFGGASVGVRPVLPGAIGVVCGAEFLRAQSWVHGAVSTTGLVLESVCLWFALAIGVLAATGGEISRRRAYLQGRIIAAQKETIARERARSEELLKRELSHQVAERSRELGAVLARSDATFDVRRLMPGERFAERYRIIAPLGSGAMGAVYEVERATDGEKLALKAVVGEVSGASAARFAREAEIGARIRHPNLISIVDVGISSGVPFLVMELVRGGSLEAQRARFGDAAWALPILRQIAEGLAALHDAGVVHRDLKPANVLMSDGVAKISDFGISRFGEIDTSTMIDAGADTLDASPRPRSSELTGTGVVMGTPVYMPPEAAKSARTLDASADVFAFGVVAYELLTGRAPFAVPVVMLAMAEQPIPTPPPIDDPSVPASLRTLVIACLAADPARRPRARSLVAAHTK